MARYQIHGGNTLSGTVTISGAKNAAVAILPAALLVPGKCRIENVPDISDVRILLDILEGMGAVIEKPEPNVVEIDCANITCTRPDDTLVKKMRASYYLMGALLGRFNKAHVALPGGCNFASRPIDQHIKGFRILGADVDETEEYVALKPGKNGLQAAGAKIEQLLKDAGIDYYIYTMTTDCTYETLAYLKETVVPQQKPDVVISVGGGKVMDMGKATGHGCDLPVINVPTSVATVNCWSAMSVMYTMDHHPIDRIWHAKSVKRSK